MERAEFLVQGKEHFVPTLDVLTLAAHSGLTAYDCEFVVLAQQLGVRLVTSDGRILASFPSAAISMDAFV